MPTTFLCPHCEAKLQSSSPQIEGKRVRCAKCNSPFTVTAGLIIRDTAATTVVAEKSEQHEDQTEPERPRAKTKKKRKTSSSAVYWARTFIALALLIVIVTATIIILINKGWLPFGD